MPVRLVLPLLFALLSMAGAAFAQDQATTNRATELKDRPAAEARTLAPLAIDAPVRVISRQGGWTQVEAGTQRGWVRAFHLRFQSTVETSSSGGSMSGLTSVFGFGRRKA